MLHLFIRWLRRFLDTLAENERGGRKRIIKHALSGANPTNDPDNCIRCVHAWALRRMGYDVVAAPGQYLAINRPHGMTSAEYSTRYWRNHGHTPTWHRSDLPDRGLTWPEIRATMALEPEGSWGFIRMANIRTKAHVAAWLVEDCELHLIDPQTPDNDLDQVLDNAAAGSIRWINLLGCSPRKGAFDIAEGTEHAH